LFLQFSKRWFVYGNEDDLFRGRGISPRDMQKIISFQFEQCPYGGNAEKKGNSTAQQPDAAVLQNSAQGLRSGIQG